MQITLVVTVNWNGHEPFEVDVAVDPPTVKLPQYVIDHIKSEIEDAVELNEPVEMSHVVPRTPVEAS